MNTVLFIHPHGSVITCNTHNPPCAAEPTLPRTVLRAVRLHAPHPLVPLGEPSRSHHLGRSQQGSGHHFFEPTLCRPASSHILSSDPPRGHKVGSVLFPFLTRKPELRRFSCSLKATSLVSGGPGGQRGDWGSVGRPGISRETGGQQGDRGSARDRGHRGDRGDKQADFRGHASPHCPSRYDAEGEY